MSGISVAVVEECECLEGNSPADSRIDQMHFHNPAQDEAGESDEDGRMVKQARTQHALHTGVNDDPSSIWGEQELRGGRRSGMPKK